MLWISPCQTGSHKGQEGRLEHRFLVCVHSTQFPPFTNCSLGVGHPPRPRLGDGHGGSSLTSGAGIDRKPTAECIDLSNTTNYHVKTQLRPLGKQHFTTPSQKSQLQNSGVPPGTLLDYTRCPIGL